MSTFPSASYDDWKLMSPDEEHERLYGPIVEDDKPEEPDCPECGGTGWITYETLPGHDCERCRFAPTQHDFPEEPF